ncbi:MAG: hypothetical protein WC250_01010 [Candidatus Paceibacterota bacterium]|jgi:hypothetical protein
MLNKNKIGIALGSFVGIIHIVWSIMVGLGLAEAWLNFVFKLHMLANPFTVGDFNFGLAIGLVIVTAIVGYIFGWVFACVYNWAHR